VSITIGRGGHSPVADLVLDHHRAYYRPRVAVSAPPAPPSPWPPPAATARPVTAVLTPGAAVTQVLVIRVIACLVLWAAAGTVYGVWQLGNALVPANQHGVVTCGMPRGVGSIPGC
jgi:hypothetical protein